MAADLITADGKLQYHFCASKIPLKWDAVQIAVTMAPIRFLAWPCINMNAQLQAQFFT